MRWLLLLALVGCKPVYDAQYDARATELEAFRSVFLAGDTQVKFITYSDHKLYWIAVDPQTSVQFAHSYEPATGAQIDYSFPITASSFEDFHFSDQLIIQCDFDITVIHDATMVGGGSIPNVTTGAAQMCALDGSTIYYFTGQELHKWTSGTDAPLVVDLTSVFKDSASIDGFGTAAPGKFVVSENGNLWVMDGSGAATYLHNPKTTNGSIAFSDQLVVFPASTGLMFQRFDATTAEDLTAAIADGGYSLNFEHADVAELADNDEYTVISDHLIYRGKSGIFAYGFETKKVVDLLLDRAPGDFDTKPFYQNPAPVGTKLFVQDLNEVGPPDHPVYEVDLNGRLR